MYRQVESNLVDRIQRLFTLSFPKPIMLAQQSRSLTRRSDQGQSSRIDGAERDAKSASGTKRTHQPHCQLPALGGKRTWNGRARTVRLMSKRRNLQIYSSPYVPTTSLPQHQSQYRHRRSPALVLAEDVRQASVARPLRALRTYLEFLVGPAAVHQLSCEGLHSNQSLEFQLTWQRRSARVRTRQNGTAAALI